MKYYAETDLLIFDTHPIQYRSPVFRELYKLLPDAQTVFFAKEFNGNRWWFHEVGKNPKLQFGLPLEQGFPNDTLESRTAIGKFFEIEKIFDERKPKVVLLYGYYLWEHWAVWFAARSRRIPIIFIGETFTPAGKTAGWKGVAKDLLRRMFLGGVSRFISIGEKNHDFYVSQGIAPHIIDRAKYCIDNEFFTGDVTTHSGARKKIRQELGIEENEVVLLFVGRIFDRKRPLDVVTLHEKLNHPRVHTVIVGNGEKEDELKEKAKGVPRVHLTGFKSQAEIRELYLASDILVLPSEFETWGLVVNEAFACGMTAVVSDTCGTAGDLVLPGETGLVFTMGRIETIVPALAQVVDDARALRKMRESAFIKVTKEYTPMQFAEVMRNTYETLAGKKELSDEAMKETIKLAGGT